MENIWRVNRKLEKSWWLDNRNAAMMSLCRGVAVCRVWLTPGCGCIPGEAWLTPGVSVCVQGAFPSVEDMAVAERALQMMRALIRERQEAATKAQERKRMEEEAVEERRKQAELKAIEEEKKKAAQSAKEKAKKKGVCVFYLPANPHRNAETQHGSSQSCLH